MILNLKISWTPHLKFWDVEIEPNFIFLFLGKQNKTNKNQPTKTKTHLFRLCVYNFFWEFYCG